MKRQLIILFFLTSINLFSQTKLTKDAFFPIKEIIPEDFQTIVGDPKGWRLIGYFNLNNNKIEPETYPWDTLHIFTPFRKGKMFSKFSGHNIIFKGDKKIKDKIIYVDKDLLILEGYIIRKTSSSDKKVKARQLYRRVL